MATVSILSDAKVIIVDEEHRMINFNEGGAELSAQVDAGVYIPRLLAAEIQSKVDAVAAANITCTYSDSTHMFTISSSGGTFQLLLDTGTDKDRSVWSLIGFDNSADKTGSTSYSSDSAIFTSAEKDHILRIDATGYKDDASGTYTGLANAAVQKAGDVFKFIMVALLKKPSSIIDETLIQASRTSAPYPLGIYLNSRTSMKDVLDSLEFSVLGNISVCGNGVFHFSVFDDSVPANVVDLYDRDFLSFEMERGVKDVYISVLVNYSKDPATDSYLTVSKTNAATELLYGRIQTRSLDTYLVERSNAAAVGDRLIELAQAPVKQLRFAVKGKLLEHRVGDKVRVTRSRGIDSSGSLDAVLVRIVSVQHNHQTGVSQVEAVVV